MHTGHQVLFDAKTQVNKQRGSYMMTDKVLGNNQVNVYGEVISDFTFSHEVYGEGFYTLQLSVRRLSNVFDTIPLMVSERLIDVKQDYRGKFIEASGQFRSYNRHEENHNRLVLSMFVRDIRVDDEPGECEKPNHIFLDGYICKVPVYRKTPLGREIADVLLAVNRPYGKSDYIPCICWGRNARFADGFQVGDTFSYGEESRVVSIKNALETKNLKLGSLMRYP